MTIQITKRTKHLESQWLTYQNKQTILHPLSSCFKTNNTKNFYKSNLKSNIISKVKLWFSGKANETQLIHTSERFWDRKINKLINHNLSYKFRKNKNKHQNLLIRIKGFQMRKCINLLSLFTIRFKVWFNRIHIQFTRHLWYTKLLRDYRCTNETKHGSNLKKSQQIFINNLVKLNNYHLFSHNYPVIAAHQTKIVGVTEASLDVRRKV